MKMWLLVPLFCGAALAAQAPQRTTTVAIVGDAFHVNGRPTLEGRAWRGYSVEGLLPNSRMVQGVFDDLNPDTRSQWAYPDTKTWDPGPQHARIPRRDARVAAARVCWPSP